MGMIRGDNDNGINVEETCVSRSNGHAVNTGSRGVGSSQSVSDVKMERKDRSYSTSS